MMKQLQWLIGALMPAGRSYMFGRADNEIESVDWGQTGGFQSPYGDQRNGGPPAGYTVPAGHVLGLTHAALSSKHALSGYYKLLPQGLSAQVPAYDLAPNGAGGFTMAPRNSGTIKGELTPYLDQNGAEAGVPASSYLVIPGVESIPDIIGARTYTPPLILPAGFQLIFGLSNNTGAQWMHIVVQGILAPLEGRQPDEVFVQGASL